MRAHSRTISSAVIGAMFLLLGTACAPGGSTGPSDGSGIRVFFHNLTGRTITVVVDGPSFSPATYSPAKCGLGEGLCTTDELPGVVGDIISFDVSGSGLTSGSRTCRVGPGMWSATAPPAGADYGVVEFRLAGSTLTVGCAALWQ